MRPRRRRSSPILLWDGLAIRCAALRAPRREETITRSVMTTALPARGRGETITRSVMTTAALPRAGGSEDHHAERDDYDVREGSTSSLTGKTDDCYYREVARLGAQVAEALAYAHKRRVLHRDIKPPNLILDPLGNIWITDFGLAKFEDGENLSQSQDVAGTLRYMAPERFAGISDRRCDVYALGATLYEMLTLRPPLKGRTSTS